MFAGEEGIYWCVLTLYEPAGNALQKNSYKKRENMSLFCNLLSIDRAIYI